jgi:hypothetical protein
MTGSRVPLREASLVPVDASLKQELETKILSGERLTREDGVALYECDDLLWLGRLAHHVRTEKNGDRVMFNVNRHLNLTNVCAASCAYCSFQRKPGEKDAYTMRVHEAVAKAREMEDEQLTELHIVNGLHPTLPWKYYPKVLRELKAALPHVSLKCFTATEIHWFEKISGRPADEILDELIDVADRRRCRDLRLGGPGAHRRPRHPLGGLVAHPPAGPRQGPAHAGDHAVWARGGAPPQSGSCAAFAGASG